MGVPALMFWAVGNELDHVPGKSSYHPQLWDRLNELAVAIKQIDKHHPVLTVVGTGHYERKVQEISAACKDMDLLGVNAYGDLGPVTELTRRHWPKPYVVAEWGPTGHWAGAEDQVASAVGADEQRKSTGDRRAVRADHPGRPYALPGLVRILLEREVQDRNQPQQIHHQPAGLHPASARSETGRQMGRRWLAFPGDEEAYALLDRPPRRGWELPQV